MTVIEEQGRARHLSVAVPVTEREVSLTALVRAGRNRLWYRREMCFYLCSRKTILDLPRPRWFRRDCFADLQAYEVCDRWQMQPEEYRRISEKRAAQGHHLYTLVHEDKLVFYGWLADRQSRREEPLFGQVFFPPADSAMLYDCYTHPAARGRGLYYQALCQMLHDAQEIAEAEQVCIGSLADNFVSRHVIEKIGFRYIGSLIKKGRLLFLQRYSVAVDAQFRTALV